MDSKNDIFSCAACYAGHYAAGAYAPLLCTFRWNHAPVVIIYKHIGGESNAVAGPGNAKCTLCGAGKYANTSGQSACESCDPGRYADTIGSIDCDLCGIGYMIG